MKQLCGYLLHPTIPTQSPNIRIADIGTGTGYPPSRVICHWNSTFSKQSLIKMDQLQSIWPLELSRELPGTARIDGFDISPAQYPHRNWLPANVILYVHNAFAPFPQEYAGVYDVVHVRFFVTLINEENVAGFIQNLMVLLSMSNALDLNGACREGF